MPASVFDFVRKENDSNPCEVGANFSYQIAWQREDAPDSGNYIPVPMPGYSALMQVRRNSGTDLVIELSSDNGRITIDETNGIMDLFISAADTTTLPPGIFRYDLKLTDVNGFVTRFIEGSFEVVGEITA